MTATTARSAANDNARTLTRAERLGALLRLLRVGIAAGRLAADATAKARAGDRYVHQDWYVVEVRPKALRLSEADARAVEGKLSVGASVTRGVLRLRLGGYGPVARDAARSCAATLRSLGVECAVDSFGWD